MTFADLVDLVVVHCRYCDSHIEEGVGQRRYCPGCRLEEERKRQREKWRAIRDDPIRRARRIFLDAEGWKRRAEQACENIESGDFSLVPADMYEQIRPRAEYWVRHFGIDDSEINEICSDTYYVTIARRKAGKHDFKWKSYIKYSALNRRLQRTMLPSLDWDSTNLSAHRMNCVNS